MNRLVVVSAVVVFLLAGCSPASPEVSVEPSQSPNAIPSPTDEPSLAPNPFVVADCDDLATTAQVTALSTTTMAPTDPKAALPSRVGPKDYAVRQLQGLECTWDNGLPYDVTTGGGRSALRIVILPNAEGEWANYSEMYGDHSGGCSASRSAECYWDSLTPEGVWVEIHYDNLRAEDARTDSGSPFMQLVDSVLATVASAAEGSPWSPHARVALPDNCDLLNAEVIGGALGVDPSVITMSDGYIGGTSLDYEATATAGSNACLWNAPQLELEYGFAVNALIGGEWAWDEAHGQSAGQPLVLTGLGQLDSAWLSSYSLNAYAYYTVDLIIGGNWISFTMPQDSLAAAGADATALTLMAQAIVDRLH